MKLKTITLLAGIAQSVAFLFNAAGFTGFAFEAMSHPGFRSQIFRTFVNWPVHVVAQAMFAFFLFFLYAKQRDN